MIRFLPKAGLAIFDMDHTICNCNLGLSYFQHITKKNKKQFFSGKSKTYRQYVDKAISEGNFSLKQLDNIISRIGIIPGMKSLITHLNKQKNFDVILISSGIDLLINRYLDLYDCRWQFSHIFSNSMQYDPVNGKFTRLSKPIGNCQLQNCQNDSCKRLVLKHFLQKRNIEGLEPYPQIYYIGDGINDYCPIVGMDINNTAFIRYKYGLYNKLKMKNFENIKCKNIIWDNGHDIIDYLKFGKIFNGQAQQKKNILDKDLQNNIKL